MNLIFCIHENYFYHFLSSFQSEDPASIYNPIYLKSTGESREFSIELRDFMNKYVGVVSHYPFYNANWEIATLNDRILNYFKLFPQFSNLIIGWQGVWPEIKKYFQEENDRFNQLWTSLNLEASGKYYSRVYSPFVKEANSFFEKASGIMQNCKLEIHFVKAMPITRGKNINYNNKKGLAISFPPIQANTNLSAVNLDYLYTICHELAHHYSDELLLSLGYELPEENNGQHYIQREESADYLTRQFFNSILLPINNDQSFTNTPLEFKEKIKIQNSLYGRGIKNLVLNTEIPIFQSGELSNTCKIDPDMFVIGSNNDSIFFFSAGFGRLYEVPRYFMKKVSPDIEINKPYTEHFKKSGFLVPSNYNPWIQTPDNMAGNQYTSKKYRFHMTQDCNLQCQYCYLDAGKKTDRLTPELAAQTFDGLLPKNYEENEIEIEFHGGGEPTMAFDEMNRIVDIAVNKIEKPVFRIQSNGVFSRNVADWLIEKKFQVSISMDGPEFIQNKQRPSHLGSSINNSFNVIESNIKYFIDQKVMINVISVITDYSLPHLREIYDYFVGLGVRSMQFNPLHRLGRAIINNESYSNEVDLVTFADHFLSLQKQAIKEGIILVSDFFPVLYNYTPRDFQCNACRPGCNIHHNGDMVACTRTYDLLPSSENPFVWGSIKNGTIEIDEKKRIYLQNRLLKNMPECQECFLKYECAGDCLSELYQSTGDMYKVVKERCDVKRDYGKKLIMYLLEKDK